jgi:hypothetical protein
MLKLSRVRPLDIRKRFISLKQTVGNQAIQLHDLLAQHSSKLYCDTHPGQVPLLA